MFLGLSRRIVYKNNHAHADIAADEFWRRLIDASLYELDEELKKVDELLSDTALVKPFEEVFDPNLGRPGTAVGIYLRMMYLKFRWGLSYEEVERSQGEIAVAVFLPAVVDGSSPGRHDFD